MPMLAVQSVVQPCDIPTASVVYLVFQQLGPSIFIAVAQTVWLNSMLPRLKTLAPTISEAELLGVGATGFRALVSASALPSVLEEYASSLGKVFIMSAILAAVASASALGVEWKNIKKVKVTTRTNEAGDKGRLDEPTTLHLEGQ